MTHTPPVAFIGKAGAGKTTCSNILIEQFGYERLSFAEPLKIGCGTRDDRALLQKVGVGVRDLYPDFWVNLALDEMDRQIADAHYGRGGAVNFVCDDCRFWNEAMALKNAGFVLVRVTAPRTRRVDRLKLNGRLQDESQLDHESETALDDFNADHRIVNDGWPDSLPAQLADILNKERS